MIGPYQSRDIFVCNIVTLFCAGCPGDRDQHHGTQGGLLLACTAFVPHGMICALRVPLGAGIEGLGPGVQGAAFYEAATLKAPGNVCRKY